jgi:ribosome-associated translation inhibitor RaiA
MNTPLQITYRDMEPSPAVEESVRGWVAKLERICDCITACHVMIEAPHHHKHQGRHFHVRIDLVVPGAELVVGRDPTDDESKTDAHVAIRDAFRAARRQLADWNALHRSHHAGEPTIRAGDVSAS